MPKQYGTVQPVMVGMTPEQVKAAMEKILWWAGLGAGIFGPGRGAIVKAITPILTSDEFCAAVARLLSNKQAGDKFSYSDLVEAS